MMPWANKTIDKKIKPAKKLNELPYEHEHICFKCDSKYLYHNIYNIKPFRCNILEYCDFIY